METKTIVRVNNVDIIATSDEQQLVPIRPICEALGIDYSRQLKKIKDDPDLGSVVGLKPTTGADGKTYEMCCLPLEYIFGWLFTISPSNVHEDAQEIVRKYRMECYHALFQHFTARARFVEEKQKEIDHQLTVVDAKPKSPSARRRTCCPTPKPSSRSCARSPWTTTTWSAAN